MSGEFRIAISDIEGVEPSALAQSMSDAYGDDWDAALGDFAVVVLPDDTVLVTVRNVTGGDVDALAADIEQGDHEGTFTLRMSQRQGSGWFYRDAGDDEL